MYLINARIKKSYLFLTISYLVIIGICTGCLHKNKVVETREPASVKVNIKYDLRRGSPAEYDPGAPADSKWIELFGSTPNYRSIGITTLNGSAIKNEKFRWEFGPMWYRGRLTSNSVKAFIVGQEGAQDENISNRAFTGSTGTRVQKFLNHLGIYRSYLFLNTFVYTINGQLTETVDGKQVKNPKFDWLEQGLDSPIVIYRHKLFDNMLATNTETVSLFMGVGSGGKASLATWINARGGKCSVAYDMKNCDTTGMAEWFKNNYNVTIKNKILAIGVPHPGGANPNLGGDAQLENIKAGFTQAAQRVAAFKTTHQNWLISDQDEKATNEELIARLNEPYVYKGYAPIPFRDFAFNTNWRMGSEGTTSNRWGSSSIQIYSDAGEYNDKNSKFKTPYDLDSGLNAKKTALIGMHSSELPYESPRYLATKWNPEKPNFDYGPCGYIKDTDTGCELSKALNSWPDLKSVGINSISHESFGYFGTYRGRADHAQVYILADQTSHDDMFSTRALTGTEGQRLQAVLNLSGVGLNYFIQRTLPVDTLGLPTTDLVKAVIKPEMIQTYQRILNAVLKRSSPKIFVALGPVASIAINQLMLPQGSIVIKLNNLNDVTVVNTTIKSISDTLQTKVSGMYSGQLMTIPREDLPYHTRWWMGSSGDRAARGEDYSLGNFYRIYAPYWVSKLYPKPLTQAEKTFLNNKIQSIQSIQSE